MSFGRHHVRSATPSGRLDIAAIRKAVWQPFALWASVVLFILLVARQPGVLCATPVAWLMACWVGMSCVARSKSSKTSTVLIEAGLAGGAIGLLQGLLFAALAPLMGRIRPDEQHKALFLSAAMIILGTIISAILSMAVGAAQNRKIHVKLALSNSSQSHN